MCKEMTREEKAQVAFQIFYGAFMTFEDGSGNEFSSCFRCIGKKLPSKSCALERCFCCGRTEEEAEEDYFSQPCEIESKENKEFENLALHW